MEQNFSWPRDVENNAIGPDRDAEKIALVTKLLDNAVAGMTASQDAIFDRFEREQGIDYPPSPGDEQIDQQTKGWYVNQPRPTALREILMYVRNVRQQLEYVEAAVRRMENL